MRFKVEGLLRVPLRGREVGGFIWPWGRYLGSMISPASCFPPFRPTDDAPSCGTFPRPWIRFTCMLCSHRRCAPLRHLRLRR